jgi:hypothetical protein
MSGNRSFAARHSLSCRAGLGLGCLAMLLAVLLIGCTTVRNQTKKVVGVLPFAGERLRKKVVIVPFENTTFLSDEAVRQRFMDRLSGLLAEECDRVLWIQPEDPGYPEVLGRVPRLASGRIDNLALAEIGRGSGINAFLLGNVASIDAEEKEKGILMFRDIHYFESTQIGFQLYDTGTGAKLMDESIKASTEVDGAEFDAIIAKDLPAMYELDQTLERIASEGAEKVCDSLGKHPWQGFVVAVQDDAVTLSAGRENGITVGDVLKVYGVGEVVEGKFGQRFVIPGPPAGEIEITSVADGRSEARLLDGAEAVEGAVVKLD